MIREKLAEEKCLPVFLSKKNIEEYYHGFSNRTIWPLFHYFPQYAVYSKTFWESYRRVNHIFCETLEEYVRPGDAIWIQDYHLMLLPRLIRDRMPETKIGFFLHTPFPSSELFRLLPWRDEILSGLLGADLIGFHTYDYVRHFLESVRRIAGYEHTYSQITTKNRILKVDAFPIGIDYETWAKAHELTDVKKEMARYTRKLGGTRIILSIDRTDYSKGIPRRIEAFDCFLEKNPEYRGKVSMILAAIPSRTGVETYKELKRRLDEMVGNLNGKYGTIDWTPIIYLNRTQPFTSMAALYNTADIALVTPTRDGMNMIAKEYIASKADGLGVLILSETAGAARELSEAIIINPNNKEAVAAAIRQALEMLPKVQIKRNQTMRHRLERYSIYRWASDFIEALKHIEELQREYLGKKLNSREQEKLLAAYRESVKRLIFLDYDGTLVPFTGRPEEAEPDGDVLKLIRDLCADEKNEVVLASGRDKTTLDKWFSELDLGLIAEHGVWIKERDSGWKTLEPIRSEWMTEIKPLLELFVDRTPGSILEEKDYSLVWHYRRVEPSLASLRVSELNDVLVQMVENLNLGVIQGDKVIEIKGTGINKGAAAERWLFASQPDFILTMGDDVTDEDMFVAMPKEAFTIKVGLKPSHAKYNLRTVREVRTLLIKIGKG